MDFISGIIFVGIRVAVLFFFGIMVWRLESHPRQNKRHDPQKALTANGLLNGVSLAEA